MIIKQCFSPFITKYFTKDILKIIHEHYKLKTFAISPSHPIHYVNDVLVAEKQYIDNLAYCPINSKHIAAADFCFPYI